MRSLLGLTALTSSAGARHIESVWELNEEISTGPLKEVKRSLLSSWEKILQRGPLTTVLPIQIMRTGWIPYGGKLSVCFYDFVSVR